MAESAALLVDDILPEAPVRQWVKIIASIEDPAVIGKILAHVGETAPVREVVRLPGPRAPPEEWVGEFT
jgi:hypothetical protein